MRILCNAKLNLRLKITGKRQDGYHLLEMVNVPVNIYDEMFVKFEHAENLSLIQRFNPDIDCENDKTTIAKAFNLIKDKIHQDINLSVKIKKNIPAQAGMGGGSSDAAFFLKQCAKFFGFRFTKNLIKKIADKVGADVPFFLVNRPAYLEGIGEQVSCIKYFPKIFFLVIIPNFGVSTAWAYANTKLPLTNIKLNNNLNNSRISFDEVVNLMENDLEPAVLRKYGEIKVIKDFLVKNGAVKSMMTGSGSAVYGVFENEKNRNMVSKLAKASFKNYKIYNCEIIGV